MSTQTPDLRTAAQAVIDRWETPLWKDAPATAGYIAALRDALAADHPEHRLDMVGQWYMVNRDGMATLCTDRADAEKEAADAQSVWPHMGPHRAVRLVEASFEAAARLEIESLRAAQPAGAQQPGAAYAALIHDLEVIVSTTLHATIEGSRKSHERDTVRKAIEVIRASHGQAPVGESLRTDALCDLSYSHGLKAGWNYCASDDLAGFERAQKIGAEALRTLKSPTAQAAPAAVAGCTRSHPHENMDSSCRAKSAIAEMRSKCARGAEATAHDLDRFVALLTAAPTTQPAPQQEPILYDPKALLSIFLNAQAGSSGTAGTLRGITAVIASWESRAEPHTWLIAAPQPSPAAQGDALDAARYRWLTADHHKQEDRIRVYEIATSMNVRGKGHIDAAIDAARAAQEGK